MSGQSVPREFQMPLFAHLRDSSPNGITCLHDLGLVNGVSTFVETTIPRVTTLAWLSASCRDLGLAKLNAAAILAWLG